MPYIEGHDLATVLRNERLTVPKVMGVARQVAADYKPLMRRASSIAISNRRT
jgi:hypothetical protein